MFSNMYGTISLYTNISTVCVIVGEECVCMYVCVCVCVAPKLSSTS